MEFDPQLDETFGPQYPGFFEFTLTFERWIFSILPASLLILVTPIYVVNIIYLPAHVRAGLLLAAKLGASIILTGNQIAILILWWLFSLVRSDISLASALLLCAASLCMTVVIYAEHIYSIQPSTFLSVYLSLTVLLDGAKCRSYFLRPGYAAIGGVYVGTITLKVVLLALEEVSKRRLVYHNRLRFPIGNEAISGFWNRSLFLWLNSTLILGFRSILKVEDLPLMGSEFNSEELYLQFEPHWKKANKKSNLALARSCLLTIPREFVSTFMPRLCCTGFTFAQPFLLHTIVTAVGGEERLSRAMKGGLIGATLLVYFGMAVSMAYYEHINYRTVTLVRGILTAAIYDKTHRLSYNRLKDSAAVTLMSTDIAGVKLVISTFHDVWASIIAIGLGLFVLAKMTGPASVLILGPAALSTAAASWIGNKMGIARTAWNQKVESRVAATSNVLAQLKSVKMSGLSPVMSEFLQKLREEEIGASLKERRTRIMLHALSAATNATAPVVVIAGGLFWTKASEALTVAQIFTILAVVAIISGPLTTILVCIPFFAAGLACLTRIQDYLALDEVTDPRIHTRIPPKDGRPGAVELRSVTVVGSTKSEFVLRELCLRFPIGLVSMIVGPVGCGKSTLLRTVLGEVELESGAILFSPETTGYCDQTAWIQNLSIRDIIIGQRDYNPYWYMSVVLACALDQDIRQLPEGDKTMAGSGGSKLSGGQKQRLALARAAYASPDILVVDDVLSAVDIVTAKLILSRLFGKGGILRDLKMTAIITTSIPELLDAADLAFEFIGNGQIQKHDNPKNLLKELHATQTAAEKTCAPSLEAAAKEAEPPENEPPAVEAVPEDDVENEGRQKGDSGLYMYYLGATGWSLVILWLFTVAAAAVAERMPFIFVRIWMDKAPQNDTYFLGFALLGAASVACTIITTSFYYYKIVPKSSETLHWRLLTSVMSATLSFISETDSGTILNRFSQDMALISQHLPLAFMETSYITVSVLADTGIVASGAAYAAPIIPLFLVVLYFIQYFYLRSSRQLRLLDLETQTPLYTLFTETASGIQHIRAFSWRSQFVWLNYGLLDYSQKPYYFQFCIQRWLSLVLGLSTCTLAVALVSFAVNYTSATSQAAIGLAMLNLITFSSNLGELIGAWVDMETSLGAIFRLRDFIKQTPREAPDEPVAELDNSWPSSGSIEFDGVSANYKTANAGAVDVLNNVSFAIQHGQKVAIKGRTGSGKSSILLALLNFLTYRGTIKIDGHEIRTIPQDLLRSRMTVLSQEGLELLGSVRTNLHPLCKADSIDTLTDESLVAVLTKVGLWAEIESKGANLDTKLATLRLSQGQRQLFCLARAILHRERTESKIVLLDEVTGRVDIEMDKRMQAVMQEAFSACTVIIITHRLETVSMAELALEIQEGKVAQVLERDPESKEWAEVNTNKPSE